MSMGPVVCLVTDRGQWGSQWQRALVAQVRAAANAGIHLVQLREPSLESGALRELAARCLDAVHGTQTRILVNDRVDVAIAAGAHGVHLRGDSVPVAARVRALCPRPFLIGGSIHTVEEARRAEVSAFDYLMFGTVFTTASKPRREPEGPGALAAAVRATTLPVLAIGGVTPARMAEVTMAGAAGAAAIRLFVGDIESAVRRLTGVSVRIDTASDGS